MLKRKKINKFYPALILTVLVLSLLMIFTIRGIYDAINMTIDVGDGTQASGVHVDTEKLENAYNGVFNKKLIPLDLVE